MKQMSSWKVKVKGVRGKFTLEDVLRHYLQDYNIYEFDNIMLFNVNMRDAMRNMGVEKVIVQLRTIAPENQCLEACFKRFLANYPDGYLGDMDIQMYGIGDDVEILGHVFHGLDDIRAHCGKLLRCRCDENDTPSRIKAHKQDGFCVGELYESYPCFDSSDFMYENRSYQNFVIRDRLVTDKEMLRITRLPMRSNYRLVTEEMPLDALPMVYYEGDGGMMLVATQKVDQSSPSPRHRSFLEWIYSKL